MTMATHIGVLRDGALVQFGTPREIYESPNSAYVASRLGLPRINILPADIFNQSVRGAETIGLRPEHIAHGSGKPATVLRVEHLGDQTRLHLELDGHSITTIVEPGENYSTGLEIKIEPKNAIYFDRDGTRIS
jgi:multiple sugar transport system ATP-binding protein